LAGTITVSPDFSSLTGKYPNSSAIIANGGAALDGLGDDASIGSVAEAKNMFLRKSIRVVVVDSVVMSEGDDNNDDAS